jgi:hypothetical protein
MKKYELYKAKEGSYPLFKKGDLFVIVKRNTDENRTPIEAQRLIDNEIYGFNEGELEKLK